MKRYRIREVTFRINVYEFIPECQKDTLLTRLSLKKLNWHSIACQNYKKHNRGYRTFEQAMERINEDRTIVKRIRRTKMTIHNVD